MTPPQPLREAGRGLFPAPPSLAGKGVGGLGFPLYLINACDDFASLYESSSIALSPLNILVDLVSLPDV